MNDGRHNFEYGPGTCVFHKRNERIDWKKFATVDVDKTIRDNDIQVLYDNLKNVAFCDVENELDLRGSDRNLIKLFKLAQLTIDYLLTSQDYLAKELSNYEERVQHIVEEAEVVKLKLVDQDTYIAELKNECHRRKKLIIAQQQIMDSGPNSYHRCPYCTKAFLNSSYLRVHLEKRHPHRYEVDMMNVSLRQSLQRSRQSSPDTARQLPHRSGDYADKVDQMMQMVIQLNQQKDSVPDEALIKNAMDSVVNRYEGILEDARKRISDLEQQLNRRSRSRSPRRSNLGNLVNDTTDNKHKHRIPDYDPGQTTTDALVARNKAIDRHQVDDRKLYLNAELSKALGNSNCIALTPSSLSQDYDDSSTTIAEDLSVISVIPERHQSAELHTNNNTQDLAASNCCISTIVEYSQTTSSSSATTSSSISTSSSSAYHVSLTKSILTIENKNNNKSSLSKPRVRRTIDEPDIGQLRLSPQSPKDNYRRQLSPYPEPEYSQETHEHMKVSVTDVLNNHLADHGIPVGTRGISDRMLHDKKDVFSGEMNQFSNRFNNFQQIKLKIIKETELEAQQKLQRPITGQSINNRRSYEEIEKKKEQEEMADRSLEIESGKPRGHETAGSTSEWSSP